MFGHHRISAVTLNKTIVCVYSSQLYIYFCCSYFFNVGFLLFPSHTTCSRDAFGYVDRSFEDKNETVHYSLCCFCRGSHNNFISVQVPFLNSAGELGWSHPISKCSWIVSLKLHFFFPQF